jgi:hypothetical protein
MKGTNVSQDLKYFEIMKRKYKGIKYLSQLKDRAHHFCSFFFLDLLVFSIVF